MSMMHIRRSLACAWFCLYGVRELALRLRPVRKVAGALGWIHSHTLDRRHLLDLRCRRNGYTGGGLDMREALLFASMATLVHFVEGERAFEAVDWDATDEHREAARELREIHDWWTSGRAKAHADLDRRSDASYRDLRYTFVPMPDGCRRLQTDDETPEQAGERDAVAAEEERLSRVDDEMMIRLIRVRRAMWT
jgi:hypothetical protein